MFSAVRRPVVALIPYPETWLMYGAIREDDNPSEDPPTPQDVSPGLLRPLESLLRSDLRSPAGNARPVAARRRRAQEPRLGGRQFRQLRRSESPRAAAQESFHRLRRARSDVPRANAADLQRHRLSRDRRRPRHRHAAAMAASVLGDDISRAGQRPAPEPGHGATTAHTQRAALRQAVSCRHNLLRGPYQYLREVHQRARAAAEHVQLEGAFQRRSRDTDRPASGDQLSDSGVCELQRLLEHGARQPVAARQGIGRLQQPWLLHRGEELRFDRVPVSVARPGALSNRQPCAREVGRVAAD